MLELGLRHSWSTGEGRVLRIAKASTVNTLQTYSSMGRSRIAMIGGGGSHTPSVIWYIHSEESSLCMGHIAEGSVAETPVILDDSELSELTSMSAELLLEAPPMMGAPAAHLCGSPCFQAALEPAAVHPSLTSSTPLNLAAGGRRKGNELWQL